MASSSKSDALRSKFGWFHLHTDASHGASSIEEYFELARRLSPSNMTFLEHVRRRPTYDPVDFSVRVARQVAITSISASTGFEARLLVGGGVDSPASLLDTAAVIGVAEHGYSGSPSSLARDFKKTALDLRMAYPTQTFVWVHPGSWLQRNHSEESSRLFDGMLSSALEAGFLIERNLKYNLVTAALARELPSQAVIVGLDAHSVQDVTARVRHIGDEG